MELLRQVEIKQKGIKREALNQVNDVFENSLNKNKSLYSIVPERHCAKCGGVILQREGIFPMITPGGSPIRGCPVCETWCYNIVNPDIKHGKPAQTLSEEIKRLKQEGVYPGRE